MKLALFGATGNLGARVLEQAAARGHAVTALVRSPAKLGRPPATAKVLAGDALDAAAVAQAVAGQDAVVNCIGGEGEIRLQAVERILAAMREAGVRRLINLGGAGLLRLGPFTLYRLPVFPRRMLPVTLEHQKVLAALEASQLDWTFVCPGFMTADGGPGYQARADRAFFGGSKVPLAAVAAFIVDELETPRFLRARVAVKAA